MSSQYARSAVRSARSFRQTPPVPCPGKTGRRAVALLCGVGDTIQRNSNDTHHERHAVDSEQLVLHWDAREVEGLEQRPHGQLRRKGGQEVLRDGSSGRIISR